MKLEDFIQDGCMCGTKREPTRKVVSGLSLLVCAVCKKVTRERTVRA